MRSSPTGRSSRCLGRSSPSRTTEGLPRHLTDVGEHPPGDDARAGPGLKRIHDLLHRDKGPFGSQKSLTLDSRDPPQLHISLSVCALRVGDRDVGTQRGHGREDLARERTGDRGDVRRSVMDVVGAGVSTDHRERES